MSDIKNPFSFGTGDIDKDQWLRDIDNELEDFITRYGNAANKHRTALLRQAFQDLRTRIANGDMLNRTADGLYQFGSALNREDKHMQEAYQRALGFMGKLARRQIQAPPAAEPEKKAIGSLEERYIKSLNPSGKFNTEAYWKNQTDEERRTALKNFLNRELKEADNYQDFGNFGNKDTYTQRLQTVMNLLESGKANDWSLQQLGFTKNWLTQPTLEEPLEKKSELEQVLSDIAAAQEALQVQQGRQYLAFNGNRGQQEFNFTTPQFDLNYQLQHLLTTPQEIGGGPGFAPSGPSSDILLRAATSKYINDLQNLLDLYFKNFATSWRPNYESGEANQKVMQDFLSKLFSTYSKGTNADGTPASDYAFDWKKYFTLIGQNQFLINGSIDNQTGRYAYYVPGEGIKEDNILDNPNQFVALKLGYTIPSLKEGGKVEFLQSGGGFDYDAWAASQEKPKALVTNKPQQTTVPKLEGSSFSTAENARIAATIADIASMGAAFVPGYGTAASAVLGLGSTATNFGADLADGQGLWNATKNAGFGLAADVMGLIPGLGGVGKGAKIARNLMWAVPKMMQWVNTYQGLQNAGEIKNSIMKLTSPSSMTVQDWQNVSQALQIMTGHGRSVATKIKKAGMSKTTTTTEPEHYIFTNKGKQKVSEDTFKKLREVRGTKARQALTEELVGEGVTLQQTSYAPWNTSTRFGAFKLTPGKTTVEVQNKHKGWFSDENLVEKAENLNPSVDIRSIMHKVNPYRTYYTNRNQPIVPQKNYSSFEARLNGEISPLNIKGPSLPYPTGETYITPKTKHQPLTDQQKAARKQKATDKKSKEKARKELEELRRNQGYALSEEIPLAGTYADIRRKLQDVVNLSSRYANEVELPIPTPRPALGPRSEAFNKKYGRFINKKEVGGVLKTLRNGGIIKAQWGDNTASWDWTQQQKKPEEQAIYTNPYFPNIKHNGTAPWYKSRFNSESLNNLIDSKSYINPDLQGRFTGTNLDFAFNKNMAYVKSGLENKQKDILSYFNLTPMLNASNLEELTQVYNKDIDLLYSTFNKDLASPDYKKSDASSHNNLFKKVYGSRATGLGDLDSYDIGWDENQVKTFGSNSFARRPVNYETKFEDDLKSNLTQAKDRVSKISYGNIEGYVYTDENGRIHPVSPEQLKILGGQNQLPSNEAIRLDANAVKKAGKKKTGDSEVEGSNNFESKFKDPYDPSLGLIASKVGLGLLGNKNIYGNLLDEMPQAPLRDPLDRKLAIVGWQEAIKQGLNQLADLRNATWMQHGSDQLGNLAGMYETENKGRDITNKAFMLDSGRQFETAQKSWNLDNEDTLYNIGVGDANRKSIADRARMMAQIRAAWRSGDLNILMGGLADASNWLLKKYQREQDLVDKTKELSLGSLESFADWSLRNNPTYKELLAKKQAGTLTEADRAKMLEIRYSVMDDLANQYAEKFYNLYHTPWFGGGYKPVIGAKDGTKLEVAKLKARGKDNDRYVSMIKDLRTTRSRRRRRRFYYED